MSQSSPSKIDSLESLRGLAALSVGIGHFVVAFSPNLGGGQSTLSFETLASYSARSGRFMVSIFFVLSGFVLARSFLLSGKPDVLTSAAVRRYPRLVLPCLAAILFAYLLYANGYMQNHLAASRLASEGHMSAGSWLDYMYSATPSLAYAFKEAFWSMFFSYNGYPTYNMNLWTMSTEMLGSFVVFGCLGISGRGRPLLMCGLILGGVSFLNGWSHIALFLAGMVLSEVFRLIEWRLPIIPAVALALASVWFGGHVATHTLKLPLSNFVYDHNTLFRDAAAIVLVATVAFSPRLDRWLQLRPLVFLGKISFGLYLVHVPLIASLFSYEYVAIRESDWSHSKAVMVVFATYVPTIIVGGYIMYLLADKPAIWISRVIYHLLFLSRSMHTQSRSEALSRIDQSLFGRILGRSRTFGLAQRK